MGDEDGMRFKDGLKMHIEFVNLRILKVRSLMGFKVIYKKTFFWKKKYPFDKMLLCLNSQGSSNYGE